MGIAVELQLLIRWDLWANRQVMEVLRANGADSTDALAAMQHVLAAEVIWLRRIDAIPGAPVELWGAPSLSLCDRYAEEVAGRLGNLALRDDEQFAETFTYQNSSGRSFSDPVHRAMLHCLTHSAHYRGEAAGFLNHGGYRVPDLDYIGWLRSGEPG